MTGHKAKLKTSSESGLIVGEISENGESWKIQFSYDNKPLIEKINPVDLTVLEEVSNNIFLDRLLRDISSDQLQTRIYASSLFCDFIEFSNQTVDFTFLSTCIDKAIDQLRSETNLDVGQRIADGIFEFIWLEKLDKQQENKLIIKLAKLNSDSLYSYLNDEDYLVIPEVRDFINNKNNEWDAIKNKN